MDGPVYALVEHDDILYAAGAFGMTGGIPAEKIAAWDGMQRILFGLFLFAGRFRPEA